MDLRAQLSRRAVVLGGSVAAGVLLTGRTSGLARQGTPPSGAPAGQLTISEPDLIATIDVLKDSPQLSPGMLECLTRTSVDNQLEPWLAETISQPDPHTWRFTLRDATFWDGSPVTATAVIDALALAAETYPDNAGLIGPEVAITAADERTVDFTSPTPNGLLPYLLSLQEFAIFKLTPQGEATIFTGPYMPTRFVVDTELEMAPYLDHWAGPPPIARIIMKPIADPNSRLLALQSGEVDLLSNFPPEFASILGPEFAAPIIPSGRIEMVSLNVHRPIFGDVAVRQAFSLGLDRAALNMVSLDNYGEVLTSLFPSTTGYAVKEFLRTDPAEAARLLDEADWVMGADGVREKDGQRLAFILNSTSVRVEQTPAALGMQSQLQPLGFAIEVLEVESINETVRSGEWDAVMKSNNTIASGSPLFEFNRLLVSGGGDNVAGYENTAVDDLAAQMRQESDPAKLEQLSLQIQDIFATDLPVVPLFALPITIAYRKDKVTQYTPHPNDYYLVTRDITVA